MRKERWEKRKALLLCFVEVSLSDLVKGNGYENICVRRYVCLCARLSAF